MFGTLDELIIAADRSFTHNASLFPTRGCRRAFALGAVKARERISVDSIMNNTLNNTAHHNSKSTRREMANRPLSPRAEEQEAALERLLVLLAASAPEAQAPHSPETETGSDTLLQLARLRAAHATYSLETIGGMERVGAGAWLRRTPRRPIAQ
ncbi:MAG: hypothetical protein JWN14_5169 [Chthonomonadales bacterium]|nr:hypothetical protein [Chthonomonadales bacterium]